MAHIAKYKASAVGKLCAHYNRWQGIDNPNVSRENIDKSRTHLNYTLGVYEKDGKRFIGKVRGSASWATVKGRIDAVNARQGRREAVHRQGSGFGFVGNRQGAHRRRERAPRPTGSGSSARFGVRLRGQPSRGA